MYINKVILYNPQQSSLIFSIIGLSGPLLGFLFGSIFFIKISQKENFLMKTLIYILVLTYLLSFLLCTVESYLFIPLLFLCFFFGSSIIPTTLGFMIGSLRKEQKSIGMSLYQFFSNVFGYLPAPVLFGIFRRRLSFKLSLFFCLLYSFILSVIAISIIYRKQWRIN